MNSYWSRKIVPQIYKSLSLLYVMYYISIWYISCDTMLTNVKVSQNKINSTTEAVRVETNLPGHPLEVR